MIVQDVFLYWTVIRYKLTESVMNAVGQKEAPPHSLARDTHNCDREKSPGQANLFNI
jgi:hypothetical protein